MTSWVPLVSGIAAGALSGIGGAITGAWLNAKSQLRALEININAEENRIRLAEKRRLYVQFLSMVTNFGASINKHSRSHGEGDEQIKSTEHQLDLVRASAADLMNEFKLVAPDDLNVMTQNLYDHLLKYSNEAYKGNLEIIVPNSEMRSLADKILHRMQKDLNS